MANSIGWGQIYCFTEFGFEDATMLSVPSFSAPTCLLSLDLPNQIETISFTIDSLYYNADTINLTADKTLI